MPIIMEANPGKLVIVTDDAKQAIIKINSSVTGDLAANTVFRVLLTSSGANEEGHFQLSYSLGEQKYLTIFGDKMSELFLTGYAFGIGRPCPAPGDPDPNAGIGPGFIGLYDFYYRNRLANTLKGVPPVVNIAVGGVVTRKSLLLGMRIEGHSPEIPVTEFTLKLMASIRDLQQLTSVLP